MSPSTCCPCASICNFAFVARVWTFEMSGVQNNMCSQGDSFNGHRVLTYDQNIFGTGWFDQYSDLTQCYDNIGSIWRWRMACPDPNSMIILMVPNIRSNYCGIGFQSDQNDFWTLPIAQFNPVGVNIFPHNIVDDRGCRAVDAMSVGNITITPVF